MTRISEAEWISYYGFRRFPFERLEAGNEEFAEPGFLSACFVEPKCFGRVLGQADAPVSALLFAARGTGKTACRVMIEYYCQNGQVNAERQRTLEKPSFVLPIPHVHLERVLDAARARSAGSRLPEVIVEDHAREILRRAVPALADALAKAPELAERLRCLSDEDRLDLNWLVLAYSTYLTSAQAAFLGELGVRLPVPEHGAIGFLSNRQTQDRIPEWAALLVEKRFEGSPLDHLAQWARLMRSLGFLATYVLVDGIDEFEESADDPTVGFKILRPLLTSLRLMDETRYLALKYFLPSDLQPLVYKNRAVRWDRGFVSETIVWTEAELIQILRRRLNALKADSSLKDDRIETGFDALCVPELRGEIEHRLAEAASGNPRRLLMLCGLMVTAHCRREVLGQDDPYQLNRDDFMEALEQIQSYAGFWTPSTVADISRSVQEIIANGENEQVEFKASLRWDYRTKSANKALQSIIARAIAGLMNAFGGLLLIGVADDGTVLGIENDLRTLAKPTLDVFRLALVDVVRTHLGVDHMALVRVRFEAIEGKWVCVVSVGRSSQPVFLVAGDTHEFWVRLGNSTRSLDPMLAARYIRSHWPELT